MARSHIVDIIAFLFSLAYKVFGGISYIKKSTAAFRYEKRPECLSLAHRFFELRLECSKRLNKCGTAGHGFSFVGSILAGSHVANSKRQGLWGMRYECSMRQLLLEIEAVRELSRKEDSPLGESEVNEIQKAVLAGTYTFSPFRIVVLKKDDPLRDKFFCGASRIA